jgi:uncharacterized protein
MAETFPGSLSAQGLAEVTCTERRTGIEGWFDSPVTEEVSAAAGAPSSPA